MAIKDWFKKDENADVPFSVYNENEKKMMQSAKIAEKAIAELQLDEANLIISNFFSYDDIICNTATLYNKMRRLAGYNSRFQGLERNKKLRKAKEIALNWIIENKKELKEELPKIDIDAEIEKMNREKEIENIKSAIDKISPDKQEEISNYIKSKEKWKFRDNVLSDVKIEISDKTNKTISRWPDISYNKDEQDKNEPGEDVPEL